MQDEVTPDPDWADVQGWVGYDDFGLLTFEITVILDEKRYTYGQKLSDEGMEDLPGLYQHILNHIVQMLDQSIKSSKNTP